MNYKSLFSNISYRGLVKAVKNDYHVLEGSDHYVVLSTNYQYKIVNKKAVKFIVKKLGGTKSITVAEALNECNGSRFFTDRFDVLNALYALAGTRQGKISKKDGNKLFFNVWKGA
jgi:hypothetical protein